MVKAQHHSLSKRPWSAGGLPAKKSKCPVMSCPLESHPAFQVDVLVMGLGESHSRIALRLSDWSLLSPYATFTSAFDLRIGLCS
jgi:hypothetical protein